MILQAGALDAVTALSSSAYDKVDTAFEKSYYWLSDKTARLSKAVGDKIGKLFNRGQVNLPNMVMNLVKWVSMLKIQISM